MYTQIPRLLVRAALFALATLSLSCSSTGRHVSDWGEIDLAPGDTGNCWSNPCRVYLQMPPGQGSLVVTANEVSLGAFPAGQRVAIGSFFESNAIKIPGAGVPPAYVYIPPVM
jgi:hypothetical protein